MIVFCPLGVKTSWASGRCGLGLLGGALAAGSDVRSGGSAPGTFGGSRSIFLRLLFLFLFLLFFWSLFRLSGVNCGRGAEYSPEIFLRQSIELEKKC